MAASPAWDEEIQYVALAAGGELTDIAVRELESVLGCVAFECGLPPLSDQWATNALTQRVFSGSAGVAKLRFALPRPADAAGWAARRWQFASLKVTHRVLALVAVSTGLPFEKDAGEAFIEHAISNSAAWGGALAAWWHHLGPGWRQRLAGEDAGGVAPTGLDELSFRGSAIRDGRHRFNSCDMGFAIGGGTTTRFPSWCVDLQRFDVEVLAFALQHELVVALSLSANPRGCRSASMPAEPRPLLPCADIGARLRCTTASLMLACACIEDEDACEHECGELRSGGSAIERRGRAASHGMRVMVDPMCGVGTLPLEAAATPSGHWLRTSNISGRAGSGGASRLVPTSAGGSGVFAMGGDADASLVAQAARNADVLTRARRRAAARDRRPDAASVVGGEEAYVLNRYSRIPVTQP